MVDIVHHGITFPDAPRVFDLHWDDRGVITTSRGARRLHRAPVTTEFIVAWSTSGSRLRPHGFSIESDMSPARRPVIVLHWGDGRAVDLGVMAEALRAGQEDQRRRDVAMAERQAYIAERTVEVHARLRSTQAAVGWAWSPQAGLKVRELLDAPSLVEWQWAAAEHLIARAESAVVAAQSKVATAAAEVEEADLVAVEDAEVRAAVLAAVQHITRFDDDLATESNGVGWSPATSKPGHVLAQETVLDAPRAVVGMRLLRRHPRQVPEHLRSILGLAA
ncbi:hypothetical protein [Lichenibacterium ramalinae]|uniref:Uncharacterized protein n=1 Tax=Lichenibacterium ramalinae TaxID=2316527 RepID=A0A4Q2RCJ2_9HYPH|nr:hypothetical protein [Lichenibacterium ramalinae]RYB03569.1 hypothetical protein D3272_15555 [Lichenibacterium ramalinae]